MKVIKNNKQDFRILKDAKIYELPKCSFNLTARAKRFYKQIGSRLINTGHLKDLDLTLIEILAISLDTYYWATEAIASKNNEEMGSGYVQVFKTGASNITPELVVQKEAFAKIMQLSRSFGLSFKDRHQMAGLFGIDENPDQMKIEFDEFRKQV